MICHRDLFSYRCGEGAACVQDKISFAKKTRDHVLAQPGQQCVWSETCWHVRYLNMILSNLTCPLLLLHVRLVSLFSFLLSMHTARKVKRYCSDSPIMDNFSRLSRQVAISPKSRHIFTNEGQAGRHPWAPVQMASLITKAG